MRFERCRGGTSLSAIATTVVLCWRNAIMFHGAGLNAISFIPVRKVGPFVRFSHEADFIEIGQYRPIRKAWM